MEAEIQKASAMKLTKERILVMLKTFAEPGADIKAYKRKIIDYFVWTVYLYKDKIVILYNISGPDGGRRERSVEIIEKEFEPGEPGSTKSALMRTLYFS